jgi:hypothetical protein
MAQKNRERGLQPAPSKSFWSSNKRPANNIADSAEQGLSRKQIELGKLPLAQRVIMLRKLGFTLQEIGDAVGATRLAVFRCLLQVLVHNERLELRLPT